MSCDLIIELHTVSASLLPSAQDVGLVRIENTGSLASFAVMHFGILLCVDQWPDGFPGELEFAWNHSLTEPLLTQSTHVFIAGRALVSPDLLLEFVVLHPSRPLIGGWGNGSVGFLRFCFCLRLCQLVGALAFDPLRFCSDGIRDLVL